MYTNLTSLFTMDCRVICQPTTTCLTDRIQTFERSVFECCPGFQVRPANDPSHYEYLYRLYYTPIPQNPVGCPIGMPQQLNMPGADTA